VRAVDRPYDMGRREYAERGKRKDAVVEECMNDEEIRTAMKQ